MRKNVLTKRPLGRKASRMQMTDTIELSVSSKFEAADEVCSATRDVASRMNFDEETTGWIDLAVREAVINAIKHGNKNREDIAVDVKLVIDGNVMQSNEPRKKLITKVTKAAWGMLPLPYALPAVARTPLFALSAS